MSTTLSGRVRFSYQNGFPLYLSRPQQDVGLYSERLNGGEFDDGMIMEM